MTTVLDAHAHLWQRDRHPQAWIDPLTMSAIDADFWVRDLAGMHASAGITGSVVVQAVNSLAESVDLLAASTHSAISGVVGWIDLTGDAAGQLDELRAGPGGTALVGIRHLAHIDPDPFWLLRDDVGAGLEVLGARALPFDLVVRAHQLETARRVAAEHPGVRFVLDHLGNPEDLAEWRTAITQLAAVPTVSAKLSGLGSVGQLREIVGIALEVFSPERLIFGTDWPVALLSGSVAEWTAVVTELVPESAHAAVFGDTARAVYGLT